MRCLREVVAVCVLVMTLVRGEAAIITYTWDDNGFGAGLLGGFRVDTDLMPEDSSRPGAHILTAESIVSSNFSRGMFFFPQPVLTPPFPLSGPAGPISIDPQSGTVFQGGQLLFGQSAVLTSPTGIEYGIIGGRISFGTRVGEVFPPLSGPESFLIQGQFGDLPVSRPGAGFWRISDVQEVPVPPSILLLSAGLGAWSVISLRRLPTRSPRRNKADRRCISG